MIQFAVLAVVFLFYLLSFSGMVGAADAPAANPYSGDLASSFTLTGDWGGLRSDLAAKGVTIDMSLTQVGQGIVHGGKEPGWQYSGGRGDIVVKLDTQKLGLWPGASAVTRGDLL